MLDFLLSAKVLSDSLAAASSPLSDSDLIDFVTDGLGTEFK